MSSDSNAPHGKTDSDAMARKTSRTRVQLESSAQNGAHWFFWIAGLAIVNSGLFFINVDWFGHVISLGLNPLSDDILESIHEDISSTNSVVGLAVDMAAAGIFVVIGLVARKRILSGFVVGLVLYALDGLIFLMKANIWALLWHVFVLVCIWYGFQACRELKNFDTHETAEVSPT